MTFAKWRADVLLALSREGIEYRDGAIPFRQWNAWYIQGKSLGEDVARARAYLHNVAGEAERRRERMQQNREHRR